jgi:NAD+ kinase
MKKCLLVVNGGKNGASALAEEIISELRTRGIEAVTLDFPGAPGSATAGKGQFDFAVTLGGDGTALFAARLCAPLGIPILPVNLGSFGFICGIKKDEWKAEIDAFLAGRTAIEGRGMAEAVVTRGGNVVDSCSALNDIVITAKNSLRLVTLDVSRDGIALGRFKSDALIFSTATGSTAHSASAGGPIIDPALDALVVTPVCPFSTSSRPLVLPASSVVTVTPQDASQELRVLADGQPLCAILLGDVIVIQKSRYKARLHAGSPARFYATLRSKMNWSGGPVA